MYAEYYGLRELPFNVTPDTRFLYLNDCYQEAIAALSYGIEARKGFISLIGEAGTGKTTLLRRVLDTLGPSTRSVLLINPTVSFDEILEHTLLELGVPPDGGRKLVLLQRLNEFLLEHTQAGGNVALLIDEAQDLKPGVLEELRLLSNLETAREKILQIVLAGQPELDVTLTDPALRQLRQRVTLRIRIRPLSATEVAAYVRARLQRAGSSTPDVFTADALARIAAVTHGIPRVVNVLCDAALLAAFAAGGREITAEMIEDVWHDYAGDVPMPEPVEPSGSDLEPERSAEPKPPPAPPSSPREAPPASGPSPLEVSPPRPSAIEARAAWPARRPPTGRPALSKPRPAFSIPGAAAVVAILAVMLTVVTVRQEATEPPRPEDEASAPTGLAATLEATAAEPPSPTPAAADTASAGAAFAAGEAPSALEATSLVDEFRAAYEARDVDRLLALYAGDASENGLRGIDAIAAAYRTSLASLDDVHYTMPRLWVEPHGARVGVRASFVITYRRTSGEQGTIRGQAEWQLERRGGTPRIVALDYRLDPDSRDTVRAAGPGESGVDSDPDADEHRPPPRSHSGDVS